MKIDAFIRKAKTLNNYLPQMNTGEVKLTEREMLKLVILKNTPTSWTLDLRRANNHNKMTLTELQKVLNPIEEVEEIESKFKSEKGSNKSRFDKRHGSDKEKSGSGNVCRKPGHKHE